MTMKVEQFKKTLFIHGADLHKWPEDLRSSGIKALDCSPELQKYVQDEQRFEDVLKTRKYKEPGRDLAERIIAAAIPRKKQLQHKTGMFFSEIFREFSFSRRKLTMVSVSLIFVLVIGFAIGFINSSEYPSAEQYDTKLEDFLNYEGDVL